MINPQKLVCEVDFLPASYHEEGLKRRAKLWQLLVIAGFGGVLLATELGHRKHQERVEQDLASVNARYSAAEVQSRRLANLESQLAGFRARAELLTYLGHRWPTSQILAAIVEPTPDSVTLSGLEISRELPLATQPHAAGILGGKDPIADKLPAASRDLKQLRALNDGSQTVVTLTGTMSDPVELHGYLETLGHSRWFAKVSLNSIASPAISGGSARFSARLVVLPGYGEPGSPPPAGTSAAGTPSADKQTSNMRPPAARSNVTQSSNPPAPRR